MAVRIAIRRLGFRWSGVRERKMGVRERSNSIREHKNGAGQLSNRIRTGWNRAGPLDALPYTSSHVRPW
jgi:hypothetical protein